MNKLSHYTLLNTRPKAQAAELTQLLQREGAKVIELPTIEISEPLNPQSSLHTLNEFYDADFAIFVSANAVNFAKQHWAKNLSTQIIAIGKGTAEALKKANFSVDFVPADFSSEGLLELPELTNVQAKKIIIFCGADSRQLLAETLNQRGAKIKECICYARHCPHFDPITQLPSLMNKPIDAIISTSTESLNNLYSMLKSAEARSWLLNQQLLVISLPLMKLAEELGFKKTPWLAPNAQSTSLFNTLLVKLNTL